MGLKIKKALMMITVLAILCIGSIFVINGIISGVSNSLTDTEDVQKSIASPLSTFMHPMEFVYYGSSSVNLFGGFVEG